MAKGTEANLSSDKLLRIVEHMSAQRLPMRLKDIAENLNISQPTVLRYLRTMCEQGYAYHDRQTGHYALTWKICRLGSSLENNLVMRNMAGTLLSEFANRYNIGVLLAVERDGVLVYLDLVGAPHGSVNTMLRIGKDAPLHSTGSGKVMLSAMTPFRIQQIIEKNGLEPAITVVTSDFHEYRAIAMAESLGIDAGSYPSRTAWWLLPTYFIRECAGILHWWLFGC